MPVATAALLRPELADAPTPGAMTLDVLASQRTRAANPFPVGARFPRRSATEVHGYRPASAIAPPTPPFFPIGARFPRRTQGDVLACLADVDPGRRAPVRRAFPVGALPAPVELIVPGPALGAWMRSAPPYGTVLEVSIGVPYAFQAPNGQPLEAGVTAQPPSSSGLGRRPFKAVARVRIPLGVHGFRVGFGRDGDHSEAPWRSWLARRPVTAEVAGSSPVGVAARAGSTLEWDRPVLLAR